MECICIGWLLEWMVYVIRLEFVLLECWLSLNWDGFVIKIVIWLVVWNWMQWLTQMIVELSYVYNQFKDEFRNWHLVYCNEIVKKHMYGNELNVMVLNIWMFGSFCNEWV